MIRKSIKKITRAIFVTQLINSSPLISIKIIACLLKNLHYLISIAILFNHHVLNVCHIIWILLFLRFVHIVHFSLILSRTSSFVIRTLQKSKKRRKAILPVLQIERKAIYYSRYLTNISNFVALQLSVS